LKKSYSAIGLVVFITSSILILSFFASLISSFSVCFAVFPRGILLAELANQFKKEINSTRVAN